MSVHKGRNGGWDTRWDEPRGKGEPRRQRSRDFALKRDADAFTHSTWRSSVASSLDRLLWSS
jgi:hypothetical protein